MYSNKGFTLVEILIVVIILGILAAIVIPQFTEASNDARDSALVSDLQTLRSQIELYKIQHLEDYPGWNGTTVIAANFVLDLEEKTNLEGNQTQGAGEGAVIFGPYLQSFPKNPFVSGATSDTVKVGTGDSPGDGTTGWWFDTDNGKCAPNDDDSTTTGVAHKTL